MSWMPSSTASVEVPGTAAVYVLDDFVEIGVMPVDFLTPPYVWMNFPRRPTAGEFRRLYREVPALHELVAPVFRAEVEERREVPHYLAVGFNFLEKVEGRYILERSI